MAELYIMNLQTLLENFLLAISRQQEKTSTVLSKRLQAAGGDEAQRKPAGWWPTVQRNAILKT
jgi:hypothetical protein